MGRHALRYRDVVDEGVAAAVDRWSAHVAAGPAFEEHREGLCRVCPWFVRFLRWQDVPHDVVHPLVAGLDGVVLAAARCALNEAWRARLADARASGEPMAPPPDKDLRTLARQARQDVAETLQQDHGLRLHAMLDRHVLPRVRTMTNDLLRDLDAL